MPQDNPARKPFQAADQATRQAEQSYSSAAEGIREFNAKLLDIAQANTMAGLNFAAELMRTKGPTEAWEVWSRHAQSHFQRLSGQSQELAALGQRLASSSAEPLTRGFDQTFRRAS